MNQEAKKHIPLVIKKIFKMEIKGEDRLVEHYDTLSNMKADFRNFNLFKLMSGFINGKDVVDIGCGAGHFSHMLSKQGKNVIGIEPSKSMRELAAKTNKDLKVILGSAEEIDSLLKERVDTVVMLDVLEHISDDAEQVKKVRKVLKDEGEFVIVVPAYPLLYGRRDEQMGHYRRYTRKSLTELLRNNGFKIKKIRFWNILGVLPYLISEKILKKPLDTKLREDMGNNGVIFKFMQNVLHQWFSKIENNIDFKFGLSIICIAVK